MSPRFKQCIGQHRAVNGRPQSREAVLLRRGGYATEAQPYDYRALDPNLAVDSRQITALDPRRMACYSAATRLEPGTPSRWSAAMRSTPRCRT